MGLLIYKQGRRRLRPTGIAATVAVLLCVLAAGASSTQAASGPVNKEDFARFENCPVESSGACLYGETLSGEFKIGSKVVPIVNPVILQGGLGGSGVVSGESRPLIAPRFGAEALSKSSQPVPGGLTGISELIGGPVSATAELAGPVSGIEVLTAALVIHVRPAVILPIKVHLENQILGPNCYIGSDTNPILLHLTDGTTSPPAGTEPISGKVGTGEAPDRERLTVFRNNTLVDNTFPVPAATGCGAGLLEGVITALVNVDAGLPSPAGTSKAELTGNLFSAAASYVGKYDKKLIKAKEPKKAK